MEPLTDDYVAELLQKDAKRKGSNRFVSAGLGSLLSKPRGNAPKPNTRFLKHIVKEADTHNAALKRKEEEESKEKMRTLKRDSRGKTKERDPSDGERRRDGERRKDRNSERHKKRRRSRSRSRSPRERHSHRGDRHRTERHSRRRSRDRRERARDNQSHSDEASDSDPLDSAIGPAPPPKITARGRGANNQSTMDSRFDPSYDPKTDVNIEPDEGEDDWDMALEALRDRAKWRKSGAERLKAAGFTDDEVSKWEKGGTGEKDISDVRWNKTGEGREWDRGKTIDGDHVDVKANWGRLKDT